MSTPHPELNATVGRLVQGRKLFTVKPDTTLWEAIKLMAKENVHRFPVVDDAGIVRSLCHRLYLWKGPYVGTS